jgi:CheY-like chemotaxis protein
MSLKGKSIFLVEDQTINLAVISTVLRKQGASIVFDTWGDTTLSKLSNGTTKVDLIILDLMLLHGRSGYDVFDAIRKEDSLKDIPVVIVSAADQDIEMPRAREKGLNGYISKPIDRHNFPMQIEAILNGEAIWD